MSRLCLFSLNAKYPAVGIAKFV